MPNTLPPRDVHVPVLSFTTRRLIGGPKGKFSKMIGDTLGVKVNAMVNHGNFQQDNIPRVHISGGSSQNIELARKVVTQLDQKAGLIAKEHLLQGKKDITELHYGLIQTHLLSLLKNPEATLESASPSTAVETPEEKSVATSLADTPTSPSVGASADKAEAPTKTKARKILTIKFNDAVFTPRNLSQAITYIASKDPDNSYVFAAGPFGGGKTYTPLRAAFEGYNEGRFGEIILIRPSASTGKDPGAMPGNPRTKMDPYLKGGIGSNIEKMTTTNLKQLEDKKVIRAFTPDFERGETYDNAFILVDEPQNLTVEQAELLIGRLGENSIMVFAGDIGGKQNDLNGKISGLAHLIATQGIATLTDKMLRDHSAYIQFQDGDSAARNKILPHVSAALNNPPSEYAALLQAFAEANPHPARAKAIEGVREYAVTQLERAAKGTLYRYERQIQEAFPGVYAEHRQVFSENRPIAKIA